MTVRGAGKVEASLQTLIDRNNSHVTDQLAQLRSQDDEDYQAGSLRLKPLIKTRLMDFDHQALSDFKDEIADRTFTELEKYAAPYEKH